MKGIPGYEKPHRAYRENWIDPAHLINQRGPLGKGSRAAGYAQSNLLETVAVFPLAGLLITLEWNLGSATEMVDLGETGSNLLHLPGRPPRHFH